ncbi:MAG TPA: hypothetical protein VFX41_07840 [Actinomycetales bacterium]|nr:hypothetical protein [Actinomycetales bacterium]
MPIAGARFRPDHSYTTGMGAQMMSDETDDLAAWAARQAVMAALTLAPRSGDGRGDTYVDHFSVDHTVEVIDRKPRRSARVVNDAEHAAAVEFGSGERNDAMTGPNDRPQGGWNNPNRVLARAGSMVGEMRDTDRLPG